MFQLKIRTVTSKDWIYLQCSTNYPY